MACTFKYFCRKQQVGTLVYHNVIINGEKWHYSEDSNVESPLTKDAIEKMIKDCNCRENDLLTIGFSKGWMVDCDVIDL
jgi:hypothetical protein